MSSSAANNGGAAAGGNGDTELVNAVLQSINGTVNFQNVATIMGISTAGAAGKRVKRYCEKQTPPIPCCGATLGSSTGEDGAVPKTPGRKATGNGTKAMSTSKATKRKSVTETSTDEVDDHGSDKDTKDVKKLAKRAAKANAAGSGDEAAPTTPKKKAAPKPRTPKSTTAKAPKSPKAPKHPTKNTEEEDSAEAMDVDAVGEEERAKTEMKELKNMDIDVGDDTGSPAKKAKMTTTVAAAVDEANNEELEV